MLCSVKTVIMCYERRLTRTTQSFVNKYSEFVCRAYGLASDQFWNSVEDYVSVPGCRHFLKSMSTALQTETSKCFACHIVLLLLWYYCRFADHSIIRVHVDLIIIADCCWTVDSTPRLSSFASPPIPPTPNRVLYSIATVYHKRYTHQFVYIHIYIYVIYRVWP